VSDHPAPNLEPDSADQPLIRNCRFAFRCHQQWLSLERTTDPRVRYCHECARQVVLCQRDAELAAALRANQCVAIDSPDSFGGTFSVGMPGVGFAD
jgi:hypothetical protein